MESVNMFQAKSSLSRLVEAVEQGKEREIIIARNGRPAAKLVPVEAALSAQRIGVARGKFEAPDCMDAHSEAVVRQLAGERQEEPS